MCGIVGYIGSREAKPILINALKRLEYRGYDSAGIAVAHGAIDVFKKEGKISALESSLPVMEGTIGIGHTRWATHGKPSDENAHPHFGQKHTIAVVHNGVIENYQELKHELIAGGTQFQSDTDTEVIAHLIEQAYAGSLEKAVRSALQRVKGSYALAVISQDTDMIVCARKDSPLVIGIGDGEHYIASDVPALLEYTNRFIHLDDHEIAVLTRGGITVLDENGVAKGKDVTLVRESPKDAEKTGYEHFMIKEIHETPRVIQDVLRGRISELAPLTMLDELHGIEADLAEIQNIIILACGTSYHAALVGKYAIERLAKLPVHVELASEYRYGEQLYGRNTLVIAATQSGETADTLAALRQTTPIYGHSIALTNVLGSTVTRVAEKTLLCRAGPEISVAATKSFTAQAVLFYVLAIHLGRLRYELSVDEAREHVVALKSLARKAQRILDDSNAIRACAEHQLASVSDLFYIGRNINYPIALEGALKMKEVSYIHAEGYAAGELKHGPFALLSSATPAIAIAPKDHTYEKLCSNMVEILSRDAAVIAIADESDTEIDGYCTASLRIPSIDPLFSPILTSLVLQLLAYYTAHTRCCPIDQPKNLAKSVTVE